MPRRPPPAAIASDAPDAPDAPMLLTSAEVAELLRVHPKHVYRLLREGLPARRVGGEWRFVRVDVLEWSKRGTTGSKPDASVPAPSLGVAPPLIAANGDLVVEWLLARVAARAEVPLGFVAADRDAGLELLARRKVLAAGTHGLVPPRDLAGERLVQIHLVRRAIGLVARSPAPSLAKLSPVGRTGKSRQTGVRLASRPPSAGVRVHLDAALRAAGLDPDRVHRRAVLHGSHRDVVCAIARDEADLGIASAAWAARLGLGFTALAVEPYGLTLFAQDLGDPRVIQLCELAQSASLRAELDAIAGYDARQAGSIHYEPMD